MKKVFLWTGDETASQVCRIVCSSQGYQFEAGELDSGKIDNLATMTSVILVDTRDLPLEVVELRLKNLEKNWKKPIILIAEQSIWQFYYQYQMETISDIYSRVEVLFMINKFMRTIEKIQEVDEKVIVGIDLTINLNTYEVYIGNKLTELTCNEITLLRLLSQTPKKVYSRKDLLLHLGMEPGEKSERAIDHLIKRLRKKIPQTIHWEIKTVYGKGYMFHLKK
ncbi:MAG: winged helix-turn-helix domain-containing protein [Culicoidibacterales bacterium]